MSDIAVRKAICDMVTTTLHTYSAGMLVETDPNVTHTPDAKAKWARVTIRDGDQTIAGIGASAPLWRGPIVVIVDVFVPLNSGDGFVVDACKALRLAMRGFSMSGLRFVRVQSGAEGLAEGQYRKQQIAVFERTERG